MYQIYIGNTKIFDDMLPDHDIFVNAIKPQLELADNTSGSLSFTLTANNPGYDMANVLSLTGEVVVKRRISGDSSFYYKDVWAGRIIDVDLDFHNNKKVSCEGELGYFQDVKIADFTIYPGEDSFPNTVTMRYVLEKILSIYNIKSSYGNQHGRLFEVGTVEVEFGESGTAKDISFEDSTITDILQSFVEKYEGHFIVRREYDEQGNLTRYLDYLKDYRDREDATYITNRNQIEFARNLLDYSKNLDISNFCTVLKVDNSNGYDLTDISVPAGERYQIKGDYYPPTQSWDDDEPIYVVDMEGLSKYGWIEKEETFDELVDGVTDIQSNLELYRKAVEWLNKQENTVDHFTLSVKAIDLSYIDKTYVPIDVLDKVFLESNPHNFSDFLWVEKLSIDLSSPQSAEYTLTYEGGSDTKNITSAAVTTERESYRRSQKTSSDIADEIANEPESPIAEAVDDASMDILSTYGGFQLIDELRTNLGKYLYHRNVTFDKRKKLFTWHEGYSPVDSSLPAIRNYVSTNGDSISFRTCEYNNALTPTPLQINGKPVYFTSIDGMDGAYSTLTMADPAERYSNTSSQASGAFIAYVPQFINDKISLSVSTTDFSGEKRPSVRFYSSLSEFKVEHDITNETTRMLRTSTNGGAIKTGLSFSDEDICYTKDGITWISLGSKIGFGNINIIDNTIGEPEESDLTGEVTAHLIFDSTDQNVITYNNGSKAYPFTGLYVEMPSEGANFAIDPITVDVYPNATTTFTTNLNATFTLSGNSSSGTTLDVNEGTSVTLTVGADETIGSTLIITATDTRYNVTKTATISVIQYVSPTLIFQTNTTTAWGSPEINNQRYHTVFTGTLATTRDPWYHQEWEIDSNGQLHSELCEGGHGSFNGALIPFENGLGDDIKNYTYIIIYYKYIAYRGGSTGQIGISSSADLSEVQASNFGISLAVNALSSGQSGWVHINISDLSLTSKPYLWVHTTNIEVEITKIEATNILPS